MRVPPGADREARIEAAFDAVGSAGGEDFEIVEDSDIVEVRLSIYLSFSPQPALSCRGYPLAALNGHSRSKREMIPAIKFYAVKD